MCLCQVDGVRGLAPHSAIKETRSLRKPNVELVEVPYQASPTPSSPVERSSHPFVETTQPSTADPLEEFLKEPSDPGLVDSFLNPSSTVGPDFATASVQKFDNFQDGSISAHSNLEPSPVVQSPVEETATSTVAGVSRTVDLVLQGDKFMDDDDLVDDDETDVQNEDDPADDTSEEQSSERKENPPAPDQTPEPKKEEPRTEERTSDSSNEGPLEEAAKGTDSANSAVDEPPVQPKAEMNVSGEEASGRTSVASNITAETDPPEEVTCQFIYSIFFFFRMEAQFTDLIPS